MNIFLNFGKSHFSSKLIINNDLETKLHDEKEPPPLKIAKLLVEEVDEGSDKENDDGQDSEEESLRTAVNTVEVEAHNENQPVQGEEEESEVKEAENDKLSNGEVKQIQNESQAEDVEEEEEDYEVEEIVDYKVCKKRKVGLYRVKWCGWGSESDTWEPLENVEHCSEHLCSFYKSRLDARSGATPHQKKSLELPPRPADYEEVELREEPEPELDYEVERILDYQNCRDRQAGLYLVKWVGWDEDTNTWEPEANLGCPELLAEFYKERLEFRQTATPAEKRAKPLPPDPREAFTIRQDFLRENAPPASRKQLEKYFQADKEKPAAKRAKMVAEKMINAAVDQCVKSSRPNEQKLRWIQEQLLIKQMTLARRKQVQDMKDYEKEINEIDPHAHVSVINDVDLESPPRQMQYINAYRASEGISIPDDPLVGCSCETCDIKNKTCCPKTSGDFHFPYTKHGKLREIIVVSHFSLLTSLSSFMLTFVSYRWAPPCTSVTSAAPVMRTARTGSYRKAGNTSWQSSGPRTAVAGGSRPWRTSRPAPLWWSTWVRSSRATWPRNEGRNTTPRVGLTSLIWISISARRTFTPWTLLSLEICLISSTTAATPTFTFTASSSTIWTPTCPS